MIMLHCPFLARPRRAALWLLQTRQKHQVVGQMPIHGRDSPQVSRLGVCEKPELGLALFDLRTELQQVRSLTRKEEGQDADTHALTHQFGHGENAVHPILRLNLRESLLAPHHAGVVRQRIVRCDPVWPANAESSRLFLRALACGEQRNADGAQVLADQVCCGGLLVARTAISASRRVKLASSLPATVRNPSKGMHGLQ